MVAVMVMAVMAMVVPGARAETYGQLRTWSNGRCYNSGSNWHGAKANIEVRSGSVSAADRADSPPGFILETLWIMPQGSPYWVEVGYVRDFDGDNDLCFYWGSNNTLGFHYHEVWNLNADAYIGQDPEFRMVNTDGTNSWVVKIDGTYADDIDSDHTATVPFDAIDWFQVGLESNCTSGKMGTQADPVNTKTHKKTTDRTTWSFAPGLTPYNVDENINTSPPLAYGAWGTVGQNAWNYRNTTPP
jgi:hypothetical protein